MQPRTYRAIQEEFNKLLTQRQRIKEPYRSMTDEQLETWFLQEMEKKTGWDLLDKYRVWKATEGKGGHSTNTTE